VIESAKHDYLRVSDDDHRVHLGCRNREFRAATAVMEV
jgi:hypothetical protein